LESITLKGISLKSSMITILRAVSFLQP